MSTLTKIVLGSMCGGICAAIGIVFFFNWHQARQELSITETSRLVTLEGPEYEGITFEYPAHWHIVSTPPKSYPASRWQSGCFIYLENSTNSKEVIVVDLLDSSEVDASCWHAGDFTNSNTRSVSTTNQEIRVTSVRWQDGSSPFWQKDWVDESVLRLDNQYVGVALLAPQSSIREARTVYDRLVSTIRLSELDTQPPR